MSLLEELRGLGADVEEGLDRVMGDASIYEMMLGMFVSSVRDNPIAGEEFDRADLTPLIEKIHMFKGVTGNLSLTPLFTGYQEALALLRAGRGRDALAEYEKLLPAQTSIVECLLRHQTA